MLLKAVGVANGHGDDLGAKALVDVAHERLEVLVLDVAEIPLDDLLGAVLPGAHAVQFGHVFDGGDEIVDVIVQDGRHRLDGLRLGPEG